MVEVVQPRSFAEGKESRLFKPSCGQPVSTVFTQYNMYMLRYIKLKGVNETSHGFKVGRKVKTCPSGCFSVVTASNRTGWFFTFRPTLKPCEVS